MNKSSRHLLYDDAAALFRSTGRVSTSFVQRTFGIGYDEAKGIVEELERGGIVTAPNHVGLRTLAKPSAHHQGLPVAGYTLQSAAAVEQVNLHKQLEERMLRILDELKTFPGIDQRWLAAGRTDIEKGFMAVNRAVFCPQRVELPEDEELA